MACLRKLDCQILFRKLTQAVGLQIQWAFYYKMRRLDDILSKVLRALTFTDLKCRMKSQTKLGGRLAMYLLGAWECF